MKRFAALILALALCLSLIPAALASEPDSKPYSEPEELTELKELKDYTYESAWEVITTNMWEGVSCSVNEAKLKFWLPAGVVRMELTEKAKAAGYLISYGAPDLLLIVSYMDYDGISLEEYLEIVTDSGYENARMEEVNGIDTVIYDEPQEDGTLCRVAASVAENGRFLEFVYRTNDSRLDFAINVSIATIRPRE